MINRAPLGSPGRGGSDRKNCPKKAEQRVKRGADRPKSGVMLGNGRARGMGSGRRGWVLVKTEKPPERT